MERRRFIKSGSALIAAISLMNRRPLQNVNPDNDITKFNVGDYKCTLFRDLLFKYLAKDFFVNASQRELDAAATSYHLVPDIPSPFIALLLESDSHKILIDTGVGFSENVNVRGKIFTFRGKLGELMRRENVKSEDITDVVITHCHPDHIGGIFSGERLNFPNARFYLHEDEWNFWHSSSSSGQPDQFSFFVEKNITPMKSRNLKLVTGDFNEIIPGITCIRADGHTPGQIAIHVNSANSQLLYISDALLHPLHIERLDWETNYDLDRRQAKRSRKKLIDLAYKENMLVNAFHFDFPGLGRISRSGVNWKWNYLEHDKT